MSYLNCLFGYKVVTLVKSFYGLRDKASATTLVFPGAYFISRFGKLDRNSNHLTYLLDKVDCD